MQTLNILCSSNKYKERATAAVLYSFTDEEENKVLDYIKSNLKGFFDGSPKERAKRFKDFFSLSLTKNSLAEAINSDTNIYATVWQVPNINTV